MEKDKNKLKSLKVIFKKYCNDLYLSNNYTILMHICGHASIADYCEELTMLLKLENLNINIQNKYENTALMYLCKNKNLTLEMLTLFLDNSLYLNVNIKNNKGYTALMYLCKNENVTFEMLSLFLNFSDEIDINAFDNLKQYNALYCLFESSIIKEELIYLIINHPKYDINCTDCYNRTLLHNLVNMNAYKYMKYIIE